jgi:hypothetical protein
MESYEARGYCAIGSRILEYCLADHGIKAELVKGYMIMGGERWTLHIWNKIHLDGPTRQIDIVHIIKECPFKLEYTLTLSNKKWQSPIKTKEE